MAHEYYKKYLWKVDSIDCQFIWDSSCQIPVQNIKSSHPEVFCKKVFLKNSQNLQENTCAGVSFQ